MKKMVFFLKTTLIAILIAFQSSATEYRIVVPPEFENESSPAGGLMFSGNQRYQILYISGGLKNGIPQGGILTSISFRLDETEKELFTTLTDIEIRASTTQQGIEFRPEEKFSSNVGPDERVVWGRGSLSFAIEYPSEGLHPFDLTFHLDSPYLYDPRNGNLLIDFLSFGGRSGGFVLDRSGSTLSRAYVGAIPVDTSAVANSPNLAQLTFIPVPEPSIVTALILGIFLLRPFLRKSV